MASTIATETQTPPPLPPPFTNTTPPPILLTQGAEAHLYKTTFLTPSTPAALKIRPSKPYRHPILDRRLTRQRVLHEARCLVKLLREGVKVPGVLAVDWESSPTGESGRASAWLLMEWIDGLAVRVVLERWEAWMKQLQRADADAHRIKEEEERVRDLMRRIGRAVGGMHKAGVVHGDLTTSNLILRPVKKAGEDAQPAETASEGDPPSMDGEIVLIDFGLAGQSVHEEDRAVDLYVLERAFGSTHPRTEGFFEEVLQAYRESYKGTNVVLKRLEEVRMRGRKRSMVG
ncbi:Serine/threonine-protein kinase bud32 [Thermoascus aurantiacus ATCC 26904]